MFAIPLHDQLKAWVDALAQPVHRRSELRHTHVYIRKFFACGRRTASNWWRAAGIGEQFQPYYYFLGTIGCKSTAVAAVVFALLLAASLTLNGSGGSWLSRNV
jgi:hypothetical protein